MLNLNLVKIQHLMYWTPQGIWYKNSIVYYKKKISSICFQRDNYKRVKINHGQISRDSYKIKYKRTKEG